VVTGPRQNAPNGGQGVSPGAAPVARYDIRDVEIARLKGELEQARRSAEVAEAQAQASRRAFAELAQTSRSFAHTIRDRAVERRTSRRRLGMQYEVVRTLARCQSLEEASPRLLKVLGDWLGWKAIARWEVEDGFLRCRDAWRARGPSGDLPDGADELCAEARVGARVRRGEGMAGRTWEAGELSWSTPRKNGEEAGVLAFPVQTASLGVTGVFVCYDGKEKALDEDLRATVILVGEQIGQAEERWRLERERNRALAGERRAVAELSGILESISDAFFALDAGRRFTYVNRKAEQLWAKRREELLGQPIWEVFPQTVGSEPYEAVERALEGGTSTGYESFSPMLGAWISGMVYPTADGGASVYFQDVTEQKEAEEALREGEERMRLATEAALMFTWEVDAAAQEVRYSPNAERVMGFPLPTAVGEILALAHPEERAAAAELYRRALRGEEDLDREFHVARPGGGGGVWIRIQGLLVGGPEGEAGRFLGITQDITARKEAEEALRESEARARLALDVARLGTWSWNPADGEVQADARCREVCGVHPTDGLTLTDIASRIHRSDWARVEAALSAALRPEGDGGYSEGFRFVHADGSVRWVAARWQTAFEGKGPNRRPKRVMGTVLDVTEQREAEERLRESEERYRTLFESMDEGFCVVEILFDENDRPVDYRFVNSNPAFERHTGLREAQGKTARELLPDLEQHWIEAYGKVASTGESVRFVEGSEVMGRWFEVHAFRHGDEGSRRVAILFKDISERKRAEEELRRSEERMRLLIESATDYAIFTTTPESVVDSWNAGAENIFGYAEDEIVGQSAAVLFTPEDRERHAPEEEIRTALDAGSALDERWHLRKDGSRFFASGALTPLSDGGLHGFVKILRDLTENKEAEDRLKESERNFRTLVSNFPGAVYRCEWREEPTMVFVSDRIEGITGYPAEDFLENRVRSYGSLVHPEDRPLLDGQVMSALMQGEPYALEYRIVRADGGVRWVNERGSGFYSQEGELLYLDGAMFDVTAREEARRALKESEERLRAVVDNAPIILCAIDRDGVFRLAEGQGHDVLGVEPGAVVGRPAFEVFGHNPGVAKDVRRALAGESFTAVREVADGLWESTYTPMRDGAGEPAGTIVVATDVTDRKRAEEERERLRAQQWVAQAEAGERERLSRELHDRVAHQMAVVHQSLELYGVLKGAAPERAETRLSLARELAKASLNATRNLSAELRRSEAEDGLHAALRDLLDEMESPGFVTELAVRGDEGLIPPHIRGQVFMILREAVRNAAQHSGGECVSVAVEVTPKEFVGSVEDDGMGLDGESSGDGTVGLKSMRERTHLLGGRFHMETGPEGTRIVVRVPLKGRRKDDG